MDEFLELASAVELTFFPTVEWLTYAARQQWGTDKEFYLQLTSRRAEFERSTNANVVASSEPDLFSGVSGTAIGVISGDEIEIIFNETTVRVEATLESKSFKSRKSLQNSSVFLYTTNGDERLIELVNRGTETAPTFDALEDTVTDWITSRDWYVGLASFPQLLNIASSPEANFVVLNSTVEFLNNAVTTGIETGTLANHFHCTQIEVIRNQSDASIDVIFATQPTFIGSEPDLLYNTIFLFSTEGEETVVGYAGTTPETCRLDGFKGYGTEPSPDFGIISANIGFQDIVVI